jgi:hypothetical protein
MNIEQYGLMKGVSGWNMNDGIFKHNNRRVHDTINLKEAFDSIEITDLLKAKKIF